MKTNVTIQFFPTGEIVEYQIRPGVWIACEILGRTETLGRYRCRYLREEDRVQKEGVVDSHNLREMQPATRMEIDSAIYRTSKRGGWNK